MLDADPQHSLTVSLGIAELDKLPFTAFYACYSVSPRGERETSGYEYRVAPGTAMTGNGDNDTPAQPQPDSFRITQWGRLGENLGGVKFPWSGTSI